MPFEDLMLPEQPSFADVQSGSSTEEREPAGEIRALSPFEDLMVGEVVPSPQPDSTALDTTKVHPVPKLFEEVRAAKHRPEVRSVMNLIENGKWALGLAGQAMGVSADVLRAWTQGEHESNPEQFAARLDRGKTLFDQMNVHSAILALENSNNITDPVERAQFIEELKTKYPQLNDATDLMLQPKLREQMAELEYGLADAPKFRNVAEMLYGNTRPMMSLIPGLMILPATQGIPFEDITFDLAQQLRKEPDQVTAGEVATYLRDELQRGWVHQIEPLAKHLPVKSEPHLVKVPLLSKTMLVPGMPTKGFVREDLPAFVDAALMEPLEVFYDPLYILPESGVAAFTANIALKGAIKYEAAAGKATKAVVERVGEAFAKKPTSYEPIVEATTKVHIPVVNEGFPYADALAKKSVLTKEALASVPAEGAPLGLELQKAMASPSATEPRLVELRKKFMRSGVGEDLRFHHTSLDGLQRIASGEKRRGTGPVFVTRTDVTKLGRMTEVWPHPQSHRLGQAKGYPFQEEFGPVRLVFNTKDLAKKGIGVEPKDTLSYKARPFSNLHEAEEIIKFPKTISEFGPKDISRVEIDPAALASSENQKVIQELAQKLEQQGVPVVIRPLFSQSEVEAFRAIQPQALGMSYVDTFTPYIDPKAAAERAIRGAPPGGQISSHLTSAATIGAEGGKTAAERALATIREAPMDVDGRVGGVVQDMGLKGTPEEMGAQLADRSLPKGASPKLKAFNPEGPVVSSQQLELGLPGAKGPTGRGGGFSLGPGDFGSPIRDINFLEQLAPPRYVLWDDPTDAIARGVYDRERRSFYDGEALAHAHGQTPGNKGLGVLLEKAGSPEAQTRLSNRLLPAVNASDKDAAKELAKLSGKELEVATHLRNEMNIWLETKGVRRTPGQPLLETVGRQIWPEEEFLVAGRDGVLKRGAFPPELNDVRVMDNIVMKHLYPGMTPEANIADVVKAISRGMVRQDVFKPAWKEMAEAAKNLPPRKRAYAEMWIKDRQGVPSKFHEVFDVMVGAAKTRGQTPLFVSAANEVSSAVLSAYYRGSLFGNASTFFANFFGQGMANQLATKGAFRTFQGLARHWKHAFDGVPKGVMTGSFEALFGKEVPKSTFGLKLRSRPGIKQFRQLWEATDNQLGMGASEGQNRSWAMHVGLGEELDKLNIKRGTNTSWEDVLRDKGVTKAEKDDLMFGAMMHSDQVNHVWGGAGANPYLRRYLPHTAVALNNMFLNWFPKQAEFLLGPLFRRGDAGILTNYILYTGWLSNLATRAWGIDFTSSSIWGSVPQAQGSGAPFPAGPPTDALWSLFSAIHEEVADDGDPNQAKRHWEEVARHLEVLTLPGVPAREKTEIFWRSLQDGGLYTPTHLVSKFIPGPWSERPRELMGFTGVTAAEQQGPVFGPQGGFDKNPENLEKNILNIMNSETPARALGLPTVSDRQRRRIDTSVRRQNKVWQSLMSDLVNEMLVEVQRQRGQPLDVAMTSPRMLQLIAAAEKQGLPIKAMFEDRILDQALPRLLRVFNDSKKLTKQQTYPYLYDAFPDYFDNPTQVWDKVHPDQGPTVGTPNLDPFEDLMK